MSYLPLLVIALIGLVLFIGAVTLPRRRRRQHQTIDTEPALPRQGAPDIPGSRPHRDRRGQP